MKCTGASILPDVGFRPDSHAKGVYCKPLDRYLLTMQTNAEARLILFISTDGDCTDDMNVIGKEFYIYYPRKGVFLGTSLDKYDYGYDDLYRVKVTIR